MRLIDSDVIIWNWRGQEAAAALLAAEPFAISAVTYMELVQGMRNARELKNLQADLSLWNVTVLPITEAISKRAAGSSKNTSSLITCNSPTRSSPLQPSNTNWLSLPPIPSTFSPSRRLGSRRSSPDK